MHNALHLALNGLRIFALPLCFVAAWILNRWYHRERRSPLRNPPNGA